jgi:hypothetical protein
VAKYASVGVAVAILLVMGTILPVGFSSEPIDSTAVTEKYLVSSTNSCGLAKIGLSGAKVTESYESFALVDASIEEAEALRVAGFTVGEMRDRTTIGLTSYPFDTLQGEPSLPDNLRVSGYPAEGLFILQFVGPIKESWLDSVESLGIEIFNYIPNYAYMVRADATEIENALGLASVEWAGIYQPAYKIAPGLTPGLVSVKVACGPNSQATVESIFSMAEVRDYAYSESSYVHDFLVLADDTDIVGIANLPDVTWIERCTENQLWDETSSEIIGGIWTANTPYGAYGNYANIAGWDGTNIVIAVADTGLGNGAVGSAGHLDFGTRVVGGKGYGGLTTWADGHGHGTHCAGIVVANGLSGTGVKYAATQYYCGAGVAPDAKLYAQKFFTDAGAGSGIPTTQAGWDTFFQDAYNAGAYVHSNSWGANTGGAYSANDVYYDQHVRDSASATTGQQPMIITVAAGNAGSTANTVGTPGNAKNVITVAASENYHPDAATYGDLYDALPGDADNPAEIIAFSSRGLRDDTAVKPDVAAPGTAILSVRSPNAPLDCLYGTYSADTRYEWCSGTSQANPHVAGAAAVITDWWQAGHSAVKPMPAMVKALMINTAIDIGTLDIPNGNEGWGRVYLPTIVAPTVNVLNYDNPQLLITGQTYSLQVTYANVAQPMKITMAYTDAPGAAASNPSLVNNLNLRVTAPGGQIWYGNAFATGMSVAGTAASNAAITGENWDRNADMFDDVNNVECVYIPAAGLQAGTYTVAVIGTNVPTDVVTSTTAIDQDFAITLYNANLAATGATATATGPVGGPTNVAAITLAYTYTGTPTSVNLYYTTNGGTSWTLAGNDATVDGSYAYTLTTSGTYGWLASAVGGSSVELSPPTAGTAPEAASYIFDNVRPTITLTSPVNAATGVLTTASVVITFSEAINTASFTYTSTPNPGGWAVVWSGGNVATLTHTAFAGGTLYTFTVTAANDLAGNLLNAGAVPNPFSFTTVTIPTTATATGPIGGPTSVAAITLTYTSTGTPTSVNLYYTMNGGTSWTLAGNDATVDGSYAYTIASGSGTYGWLASAVGGSTTELSPPTAGTAPEAASYIFDITAPAAPSAFTVQHWGPGGVNNNATQIRYMRGTANEATVNGLTSYSLGTAQDATTTVAASLGASQTIYVGIRVWKRSSAGVETEITAGTAVGIATRAAGAGNYAVVAGATWTPTATALATTDSIVVRLYQATTTPPGGTAVGIFTTEQLGASQLNAAAWAPYYSIRSRAQGTNVQWGAATTTRIENFQFSNVVPGNPLWHNTLNWTHSGTDVAQFNIYRATTSAGPWDATTLLASVPAVNRSYCDMNKGQADTTLWWYVVRAQDAVGNQETNVNAVQEPGATTATVNIPIVAGWNFISVPISGPTTLPTALLDNTNGGAGLVVWTRVMWYNPMTPSDPWKQYNTGWNAALNDLTAVSNTMGVWLYVTNVGDGVISIGGTGYTVPTTTAITLRAGWNMVGFPSDDTTYTVAMLKAACPTVTMVEQFDGAQTYLTLTMADANVFGQGRGYWIYTSADTIWNKAW